MLHIHRNLMVCMEYRLPKNQKNHKKYQYFQCQFVTEESNTSGSIKIESISDTMWKDKLTMTNDSKPNGKQYKKSIFWTNNQVAVSNRIVIKS